MRNKGSPQKVDIRNLLNYPLTWSIIGSNRWVIKSLLQTLAMSFCLYVCLSDARYAYYWFAACPAANQ